MATIECEDCADNRIKVLKDKVKFVGYDTWRLLSVRTVQIIG